MTRTITLRRADLVAHRACSPGLVLFDREAAGRQEIVREWGPADENKLLDEHPSYWGWLVGKQLLPVVGTRYAGLGERIADLRAEIATWPAIPWLRPAQLIAEEDLRPLLARWADALTPWLRPGAVLPRVARIVRERDKAAAAAAAATTAATAAAAAAATTAATTAAADAATTAAADAAAAAATADADATTLYRLWPYWVRWYLQPRYTLWRAARWRLWMPADRPSPWEPLIEMFRLGVVPIGYVPTADGGAEFVVYCPSPPMVQP